MKLRERVKVYQLLDMDDNGVLVLVGTINDIREFIKGRWLGDGEYVNDVCDVVFNTEEEYYTYVDDDNNLFRVVDDLGYMAIEECEVPIEDFFID
jgi:hypothetical protein